MKKCPISNQPIDLITHKQGAYQVSCPASGWMTSVITDIDEAIDFRVSVDVFKLAAAARREERNGLFRLVNGIWMTRYMTADQLAKFLPGPAPKKASTAPATKNPKAKTNAEDEKSNSGS